MNKPELIRVTFPDGEQICYKNPVNTIIAVLRKIGKERFPEIKLENGKRPLVSQEIYPELEKYTKEILSGWYYINRTDSREKTNQLININNVLNLDLHIEVGYFKAKSNPKIEGTSRPKHRLEVTMPDGEILDWDGYRDVFMACIEKLGPRLVSSKANLDLSGKCPLFKVCNNTGKRKKMAPFLYMALPNTAKEACKILRLIAIRLGLNHCMKIEVKPMASHITYNIK